MIAAEGKPVRLLCLVVGGFLLVTASAGRARAGEDYFLLLFGCQSVPSHFNYAHSFATFVKVGWPGDGPCPDDPRLEVHTISWLPEKIVFRTFALLPERGVNLDLHPTLRAVLAQGERVSLWGPYRIRKELYGRALEQIALLESGRVRYKAIDWGHRLTRVSNCVNAVGRLARGHRVWVANPVWGEMASYRILRALDRWVIAPGEAHPWVGAALGLGQYPIVYREWESPRSGPIIAPVFRLLGRGRDPQPTYGDPRLSSYSDVPLSPGRPPVTPGCPRCYGFR